MNNKPAAIVLAASVLAASLSGCGGGQTDSRAIAGIDGSPIKVPAQIERIATVYGPSYESMVLLGAEDRIVLCSDVQKDNFPWATVIFKRMNIVPILQNVHTAVNVEEVMTHHPDIVFGFPRSNEERKLKEARIASVPGRTGGTLAEVKGLLQVYAEALGGDAPVRAQAYSDYFDEKLKMVTDVTGKLAAGDRPSVYFAGIDLLTTYGRLSDIPELIQAAGGQAVTETLEAGERVSINFEQLAAYNPDFIFIDHGGINERSSVEQVMKDTYSDGRYSRIKAIADSRIYLSPSGVYFWDMGLQKILLLMYMAKTLHPELFRSLDMQEELKEFYSRFFQYDLTDAESEKILKRENPDNFQAPANPAQHNHHK
ncbi:MAG: hypothetical protein K0R57_1740 [Paenibacillaceae bacterium]|jgi:iron complex transport system substrate-binding protein|nr:hypothetical protein [Paenibacillaceae bacterium]